MTQTSSPGGGWQGRLSAFLHVHRGSRASSRKSSRASDASDLSELGGPWLNLPLLLLSSATNMDPEELDLTRDTADVSIRVSEASPVTDTLPPAATATTPRRRSIYTFPFFLRHQDAVETPDDAASSSSSTPPAKQRGLRASQSLHPAMAEAETMTKTTSTKRGSIVRRKRSVKGRHTQTPNSGSDVSILVTEPSPEAQPIVVGGAAGGRIPPPPLLRQQSEATVVHVLVHRESEEYNQSDEEEDLTEVPPPMIQITKDGSDDLTEIVVDSLSQASTTSVRDS